MLSRSRVSRHLHTARAGAAMARPGMDTRVWVSLAYAVNDSVVDPTHGVFVDVVLVPTGEPYTARVPAQYAGAGFGLYAKVKKDDSLVLVIPSGDPANGCVVVARTWNDDDTPPTPAHDAPDDVVLVVEPGKNLTVVVSGGGLINLGDPQPPSAVARDDKVLNELQSVKADINAVKSAFDAHTHLYTPGTAPSVVTAPPGSPAPAPHDPQSVAAETTKVK